MLHSSLPTPLHPPPYITSHWCMLTGWNAGSCETIAGRKPDKDLCCCLYSTCIFKFGYNHENWREERTILLPCNINECDFAQLGKALTIHTEILCKSICNKSAVVIKTGKQVTSLWWLSRNATKDIHDCVIDTVFLNSLCMFKSRLVHLRLKLISFF